MRSSDWSSDVCSSDLGARGDTGVARGAFALRPRGRREDEGGNRQRAQHRGKGGKSRARGKTGGKCHPRPIAALLPSVRRHPQYPFSPTRALITPRAELHPPESQHRVGNLLESRDIGALPIVDITSHTHTSELHYPTH